MSARSPILVLAALLAAPAPQAAQLPVFASGVEVVYLDVFVSDGGRPVAGLAASDFEVRDNGVLQQVALVEQQVVPVTASLVFDASGSVTGVKLRHLRAAGDAFLSGLTERERVALLTFSHEVVAQALPTSDHAAIRAALGRVQPSGGTAVRDALYLAMKLAPREGRPLVVLFTDGEDNLSWLRPEEVLEAARRSDVLVYVVASQEGAGDSAPAEKPRAEEGARLRLLRQVAQTTGGELWTASSAGLLRAFQAILQALRTRYVLSYEPRGVARAGRHALQVTMKGRPFEVRARTEYVIPSR